MAKAKEAAEQARREEQEQERRAAREAQRPPKREIVESVADTDSDWRKSAQPTQPRTTPRPLGERYVEGERHRERPPIVSIANLF